MSTPHLPLDLFPQILHEVHEEARHSHCRLSTLARLALVNKAFLHIVRPLLYANILFTTTEGGSSVSSTGVVEWGYYVTSNILPRHETLREFNHLAALVRQITWKLRVREEEGYDPKFHRELERFGRILESCPNLKKLNVMNGEWTGETAEVVMKSVVQLEELGIFSDREVPRRFGKERYYSEEEHYQIMRLLSSQKELKNLTLSDVDAGPAWPTDLLPTFSLIELEIDVEFTGTDDADDFIPYSSDDFLLGVLTSSWASLRSLTICLPSYETFSSLPSHLRFTSLLYAELYWPSQSATWDMEENMNNPLDDLTQILLRCPILNHLALRGSISNEDAEAGKSFNRFVESFPETLRYLTIGDMTHELASEMVKRVSVPLYAIFYRYHDYWVRGKYMDDFIEVCRTHGIAVEEESE